MRSKIFVPFIISYLISFQIAIGQSSFSTLLQTSLDERAFDAAENCNGVYYFVGRKFNEDSLDKFAYMFSLNPDGELLDEREFYHEDSISYFGFIEFRNDTLTVFGAKGLKEAGGCNELWVLLMDESYNIIKEKLYDLAGYSLVGISAIRNHKGNFVLNGVISLPYELPDMLFYELSPELDSIRTEILSYQEGQFGYDLIEMQNGGYKVFTSGYFPGATQQTANIVEVDSIFNYLSVDSIPYRLKFNHSAKWVNDSSFLVTGYKYIHDSLRIDMGIAKLNSDNQFINGDHFGKLGDTTSYVGAISNLDFISRNNIYFGGASNIFPTHLPYQPEDSWLILVNLDSNMNKNWQRFYGGDAFYYLWGLKATSDGGCLMLATRYDDITQDNEFDIFIVKVDSNGLTTSVPDIPSMSSAEIRFFPNPAGDHVTAQFPGVVHQKQKELFIYNNLGILVRQFNIPENQDRMQIDVSFLPNGLYHGIMTSQGRRVAAGKLIIAR